MRAIVIGLTLAVAFCTIPANADELLYAYEGDVFPWEGGWSGSEERCEPPCHESLEGGHFVLRFIGGGDIVQYRHIIAYPDDPPPPTLWVEWNFRSDTMFSGNFGCDAAFPIHYRQLRAIVEMFGDSAFSFEGSDYVLGLCTSEFHTYRFESNDGLHFTVAADGGVFLDSSSIQGSNASFIDIQGFGSCLGDSVNEWDFVRYGTIGDGEQLVAIDPPSGNLTAADGAQLRSFVLTFDRPAYLYVDDIRVTSTGGSPPTIAATKRLDNGPPDVLEVFIEGNLPPGETTTFTFDTGTGPQSVSYFRDQPEIPAVSVWGLVVMVLLALTSGSMKFARRHHVSM